MLDFAAFTPHPPIIIPGIGASRERLQAKETVSSLKKLGAELASLQPDTIVIISPHAQMEPGAFVVNSRENLEGSFGQFGFDRACNYSNDLAFVEKLKGVSEKEGIPVSLVEFPLDHGALVPLYYLAENIQSNIIHLAFSMLPAAVHVRYGRVLGNIARTEPGKVAIIASGDLSHRLSASSPYGFSASGPQFDKLLIENLRSGESSMVAKMEEDADLLKEAGECGYRSAVILMGALEESAHEFQQLSYEAPFGIGYLTARFV